MAEGVENTMLDILETAGNMDRDAALEPLNNMRKTNRYQEDIFG